MKGGYYLGVDVGTTNSKVGILDEDWNILQVAYMPTPQKTDLHGIRVYDAERLWTDLKKIIAQIVKGRPIRSIGVTGMAEPGILVDRKHNIVCGAMHSWSDSRSALFSQPLSETEEARFYQTGMHNSSKYSVYQALIQLKEESLASDHMIFLQAPSYIVWKLTGSYAVDETLALRTYAYRMAEKRYDETFLKQLGLPADLFPPVYPSGKVNGILKSGLQKEFGCGAAAVAVCGHDHMCAAAAIGAVDDGSLFLSLGTTGVLIGSFSERPLRKSDYESGYSFGLHTIPGKMTWLGAIQAAGSAIDWGNSIIGTDGTDYAALERLLAPKAGTVGEILFFPYLSGSGAPMLDRKVRGGFYGLDICHGKEDIAYAIIEGLGYEIRMIRQNAPAAAVKSVRAVGGCAKNGVLMQVLADMLGCEVIRAEYEEAALAGAAMLASGIPMEEIWKSHPPGSRARCAYIPDEARHCRYQEIYSNSYLPMQKLIRQYQNPAKPYR